MWELKGKDKTDCLALREILVARYNALGLPIDWNDPDAASALALLDKFLAAQGLTRDDVVMDMWAAMIWTKAEWRNGDMKTDRILKGLTGG